MINDLVVVIHEGDELGDLRVTHPEGGGGELIVHARADCSIVTLAGGRERRIHLGMVLGHKVTTEHN